VTPPQAQEQLRQKDLQIEALTTQLVQTQRMVQALQHQVEQLSRRLYGPRSEKYHPGQLLFDGLLIAGLDQPLPPPPAPPAVPVRAHARNVEGHGRDELPSHLERVEVLIDVPDEEKVCPETGRPLVRIGEERSEKLAYEKERLYVKVFVRPKYASAAKANGSSVSGILIAGLPPFAIAKCKADTSLLAHVAVSKYVDHQPLYRQEQIFRRESLAISRRTLDGWLMQMAAESLEPVYEALKAELLARQVLFTDDTPVRLQVKGNGKTRQARMWVYRGSTGPPVVVFDFAPDRCKERPLQFLAGYCGWVHADAYSGYDELFSRDGIIEVGCWVHARRGFDEAMGSSPGEAAEMLALIRRLYQVEAAARDLSDEARATMRTEQAGPVVRQVFARAEQMLTAALPKSPLGQALTYLLNQRTALQRYLADGRLRPDNNLAENVIRPLALGRKNWMFCGSERGGRAAAIYFSVFQTCLLNQVNPQAWLQDVLDRILLHPRARIAELLPHKWKPPAS
jgi:transposase